MSLILDLFQLECTAVLTGVGWPRRLLEATGWSQEASEHNIKRYDLCFPHYFSSLPFSSVCFPRRAERSEARRSEAKSCQTRK